MVAFEEVLEYVRDIYDHADLEADRAMLTLYLIDWKAAIELRRPISNLEWRIENIPQPTPEQRQVVLSAFEHKPDCPRVTSVRDIGDDERRIIADIVSRVRTRSDTELLRLVYSTFPVLSQPRHAPVNLVAMADKYKREYRDQIR